MPNPWYKEYGEFLSERFEGKVQKISVNTHSLCPNRDGTLGRGGCTYCNNAAFTPGYAGKAPARTPQEVVTQLKDGKRFFARKYPAMRYLAYFQSYTSTHRDVDEFMEMVRAAAGVPDVVGIIIGTRPDCIPDTLLARLKQLALPVFIELGAETSHDATLARVNRCHTWADTVDAAERIHAAGFEVGLHFILGLPGERLPDILQTIDRLNALPVSTVKFHQLQIVRGTALATSGTPTYTLDEYLDVCAAVVQRLRRDIAVDRFVSQTPPDLLIAPRWGVKNYQFIPLLHARLSASSK